MHFVVNVNYFRGFFRDLGYCSKDFASEHRTPFRNSFYTGFCPPFFVVGPSKFRLVSEEKERKERELGVGKLGWHENFDTGFERNTLFSYFVQNPVCGFFELF